MVSLSLGEHLKSAREAKGISLEEACRVTKIQRRILEAIEQGRVEEILDPSYAKIFVKKYASFLGIESSNLLQEYGIVHSPAAREFPAHVAASPLGSHRERPALVRFLVPAGVTLAALMGVGFLGYVTMDLVHTLSQQRRESPAPATRMEKQQAREPELLVPLSKPLRLTAQTTGDVWLQVKSDGAVIFQNVLAKGARESWSAKKELELWTGNAGAMQLSLNGKPLEGLGRGVKKGIRITHAGIQ